MTQKKSPAHTGPTTQTSDNSDNLIIADCLEFLKALYPERTIGDGMEAFLEVRFLQPGTVPETKFISIVEISPETVRKLIEKGERARKNVYFGVSARNKKAGKKEDIGYISTAWLDIDEKDGIPKGEAVKLLRDWQHKPSYIIDSGHGIHAYWFLREPIFEPPEFERLEIVNKALAQHFNGDKQVSNYAQPMRLPGSLNVKREPFLPVQILEKNPTSYELEDLEEALSGEIASLGPEKERAREYKLTGERPGNGKGITPGSFKPEAIEKVIEECAFLTYCQEDSRTLGEAPWYQMITNLAALGADEKIHELSSPYANYTRSETDEKIKHAREALKRFGPHSCQTIGEDFKGCLDCNWREKVKAPAGIAYKLERRIEPLPVSEPVDGAEASIFRAAMKEKGLDRGLAAVNLVNFPGFKYWKDLDTETYWEWSGKHFKQTSNVKLQCHIQQLARREGIILNDYQLSSIVAIVKTLEEIENLPEEKPVIPLENGVLRIIESKDTRGELTNVSFELSEHRPEYGNKNVFNVSYDPSATALTFERFIKSLELTEYDEMLLQEYAGYMLVPLATMNYQKCLILWGAGANGKNTFTNTIMQLLGRLNCSTLRVDEMNGFKLATMKGKIANIGTEITSSGRFIETQNFKAAISGDPITIDEKYKNPRTYKLAAKHLFSVNEIPNISDFSNGFIRRLLIIKFDRIFSVEEQDSTLQRKFEKELPGILNWALEGLKRLILNDGIFSDENSQVLIRENYIEMDPILAFADETLEMGLSTTKDTVFNCDLYGAYTVWCMMSGFKAKSKVHFFRDFLSNVHYFKKKYGAKISVARHLSGESLSDGYKADSKGFTGVKLKDSVPTKKGHVL